MKALELIQQYDKLSHFIIGLVCGVISVFIGIQNGFLASNAIFGIKEIYDTYKKNPTGFDLEDYSAGFSG